MNRSRRKVWVTRGQKVTRPKPTRFQKKFMLCFWWCSGGLVHYELLPAGKIVIANLYCRQLTTVMEKLRQLSGRTTSRFRPCLLHDNAASHTAKVTKETIETLGFRVLPLPIFSRPCPIRFPPLPFPSVVPPRLYPGNRGRGKERP